MRKPLAAIGAASCAALAGLAVALPASAAGQARAVIGNPMEGNLGFGTIAEHDVLLGSTETEGTVARSGPDTT